jgi:hypothetical protein
MFLMCRLPSNAPTLLTLHFWRHHEGRDRQLDAAEHLKGMACHCGGVDLDHAVLGTLRNGLYRCNINGFQKHNTGGLDAPVREASPHAT